MYSYNRMKFPLKEIQKLAEWFLYIRWMRKYPHWNGWERLRHTLAINCTSHTVQYNREWTLSFHLFLEEQRVWTLHLVFQCLRLPTEGISKHLTQKSIWAWVHQTHKTIANNEAIINGHASIDMAISPGLRDEGSGKITHIPSFPWKILICIL